jgi:hypothetical protein
MILLINQLIVRAPGRGFRLACPLQKWVNVLEWWGGRKMSHLLAESGESLGIPESCEASKIV